MFWSFVNRICSAASQLPLVGAAFLGLGLARGWLGWILSTGCAAAAFEAFGPLQAQLLVDIGEVLGFFGLALMAYLRGPVYRSGIVVLGSPLLVVLSTIGACLNLAGMLPSAMAAGALIAGGLGYASMLILWLELFGSLTPRRMLVAWSGSYLVAFALWPIYANLAFAVMGVFVGLLPLASTLCFIAAHRSLEPARLPTAAPARSAQRVPWTYVAAIVVFVFALNLGEIVAEVQTYSWTSRTGMVVVELAVLVTVLFCAGALDVKHLLTAFPVVSGAGFVLVVLTQNEGWVPGVLFGASSEICLVLLYGTGCALAYRLHHTAAFLCGLLAGVYKLALQAGKWAGAACVGSPWWSDTAHVLLCAAAVAITLVASVVLMRNPDLIERLSWDQSDAKPSNLGLPAVAERYGLTDREAAVLALLADGASTSDIADEFVCAQSTVRAHTSNIYRKLDVHSRVELLGLLGMDAAHAKAARTPR